MVSNGMAYAAFVAVGHFLGLWDAGDYPARYKMDSLLVYETGR